MDFCLGKSFSTPKNPQGSGVVSFAGDCEDSGHPNSCDGRMSPMYVDSAQYLSVYIA